MNSIRFSIGDIIDRSADFSIYSYPYLVIDIGDYYYKLLSLCAGTTTTLTFIDSHMYQRVSSVL